MKFDIQEELKKLPEKPGVYIMKDINGQVIYVGKAIILKNRVRQYFQKSSQQANAKVAAMVEKIEEFEYIITDNEIEALVLEANLIKKYQPQYNILLRDDKQYPYIKITLNERYPRILKTREVKKDGAKYFGPYPSATAVNMTIEMIQANYKLRTCSLKLTGEKVLPRPCLNYHIKRCLGPCQGNVDENHYNEMVKEVVSFVNGKNDGLIQQLKAKMDLASKQLNFEEAAEYRDKIKSIELINEEQKIVNSSAKNQDIIGIAKGISHACIQIFFVRNGRIVGREHFIMTDVDEASKSEIVGAFVKQFYSGETFIPNEIITGENFDDREIVQEWLCEKNGKKVEITVPVKGMKNNLLKMVNLNALETLEKHDERLSQKNKKVEGALEHLKNLLDLGQLNRIESYDISNTQGIDSVGAMIVFENGEKAPKEYRRFKIKTIQGPDDYGSMEEILNRRFVNYLKENEKFNKRPDLIMMDGGKGQVNVAERVISALGLNIPICGLIKDDRHRTRGIIYKNQEIQLDNHGEAFKLITRIQDEVHRFAITYHRSLQSQNMIKSELDEIAYIGENRKKELLKAFQSIENIKEKTVEELIQVKGMNRKAAESLVSYFSKRKK